MSEQRGWREVLFAVLAGTAFRMGAVFGMRRFGPMTGSTAGSPRTSRSPKPVASTVAEQSAADVVRGGEPSRLTMPLTASERRSIGTASLTPTGP